MRLSKLVNSVRIKKRGVHSIFFINFMVFCFKMGVKKKKFYPKLFNYYYNNVLSEKEANESRNEIVSKSYDLVALLFQGWKSFILNPEGLRNIEGMERIRDVKLSKYQVGHTPILESSKQFLDDLLLFIMQKKRKCYPKY